MAVIFGNVGKKEETMSMGGSQKSVETVVNALVAALTDDREKIYSLLDVLYVEGPHTGLGYIITNAITQVEELKKNLNEKS